MTPLLRACLFLLLLTPALLLADAPAGPYSQDFEKVAEGKPPEDIVVLSGDFAVRKEEGNSFIELAADPVDTQGFMAGPESFVTGTVAARVRASATGKRFPEFGVGSGGPAGYKVILMPAAKQIQIVKGEQTLATAAYAWTSGTWTRVKLTAGIEGGKFTVRGTAWADGADEPKEAQVSFTAGEAPPAGRPTFWATPYSGTATRFDDLAVTGK